MELSLYPLSPAEVPDSLTRPKASYQRQMALNILAIVLFVIFYLAMIAGTAYLLYWTIMYPMERINRLTIFLKIIAVLSTGMLFVFTLKFLFKRSHQEYPTRVELTESEQPKLFAFIRKLAEETGAPYPKKVFVNEEINAMVFYDSTILSLFLPVRKNLLIGLGLVNSINLSEFKAVLAHEFGHFSQRSMKLGSYIYMANRIIHDMVFSRDKWDEWLSSAKRMDIRISVFAWILWAFVWVIRQVLVLIYKGLNALHASMSQQMEFNADLVAVSVTGSDAIIHGLAKLGPASEAMNLALNELADAVDHQLYSEDIFFHQTDVVENVLDPLPELPRGTENGQLVSVFDELTEAPPQMYASHPPNSYRERNAKEVYIEAVQDDRSPWMLFEQAEVVRKAVSQRFYHAFLGSESKIEFQEPAKVKAFIDTERSEKAVDKRYLGIYDERMLGEINLEGLEERLQTFASQQEDQASYFQALYGNEFAQLAADYKETNQKRQQLIQISQQGGKQFVYEGKTFKRVEWDHLFEEHEKEFNTRLDALKGFDEKVFLFHFQLAQAQQQEEELLKRYRFQMFVQDKYSQTRNLQYAFVNLVQEMMGQGEISEEAASHYADQLKTLFQQFNGTLEQMEKVELPHLHNMEEHANLRAFVLPEKLVAPLGYDYLNGSFLNPFNAYLGQALSRLGRLYYKNLGNILKVQEQLAEQAGLLPGPDAETA